jgi:hypothetical protein
MYEQAVSASPGRRMAPIAPQYHPDFALLGWLPSIGATVLGDGSMSSANDYRINAADCLRMAKQASEERDRPLWATMAQSWLRLAEHADRVNLAPELVPDDCAGDAEQEKADAPQAAN